MWLHPKCGSDRRSLPSSRSVVRVIAGFNQIPWLQVRTSAMVKRPLRDLAHDPQRLAGNNMTSMDGPETSGLSGPRLANLADGLHYVDSARAFADS